MPTPTAPLVVGAKSPQLTSGVYVIFTNMTKNEKVTILASGGEVVVAKDTWENGDVVLVQVLGKYNSSSLVTAAKGAVNKNFGTLSEDTTTVGINL